MVALNEMLTKVFDVVVPFLHTVKTFLVGIAPQYETITLLVTSAIAGLILSRRFFTQTMLFIIFSILIFLILRAV